jgi:hypothetical protein
VSCLRAAVGCDEKASEFSLNGHTHTHTLCLIWLTNSCSEVLRRVKRAAAQAAMGFSIIGSLMLRNNFPSHLLPELSLFASQMIPYSLYSALICKVMHYILNRLPFGMLSSAHLDHFIRIVSEGDFKSVVTSNIWGASRLHTSRFLFIYFNFI